MFGFLLQLLKSHLFNTRSFFILLLGPQLLKTSLLSCYLGLLNLKLLETRFLSGFLLFPDFHLFKTHLLSFLLGLLNPQLLKTRFLDLLGFLISFPEHQLFNAGLPSGFLLLLDSELLKRNLPGFFLILLDSLQFNTRLIGFFLELSCSDAFRLLPFPFEF
ncbi:hypothetical protein L596_002048 [Steinernema carpocapsae]|uniref:Uncharacterized protein n=1 Tax=Steinernema carpocapsae TaxID=34508 RepID=A0A4U8UNB6_STECR|nr:hypothetical protein L596_002048 [Steinernema carpocapsae]